MRKDGAMFDHIAGLPAHPLAVHVPVVMIPLTALIALLYVLLPRWRRSFRWWLLAGAAVSSASAWFATQTGERLERSLGSAANIERHQEFGTRTFWCSLALLIAVIALLLVEHRRVRGAHADAVVPQHNYKVWRIISALLCVALLGLAAVTVTYVIATGHSGAEMVWVN